jgi:hypothetical protein
MIVSMRIIKENQSQALVKVVRTDFIVIDSVMGKRVQCETNSALICYKSLAF